MDFSTAWKESDGSWSWARLGATVTLSTAAWGFVHVVVSTHAIPDAMTLGGLGSWAVAPYLVNKVVTAAAKKDSL